MKSGIRQERQQTEWFSDNVAFHNLFRNDDNKHETNAQNLR